MDRRGKPLEDLQRSSSLSAAFFGSGGNDRSGESNEPNEIAGFRILRRLGIGGMGVVYEAMQRNPPRRVAIKILRPEAVSAAAIQRMEYESRILGRLQHPSIARIFESGVFDNGLGVQPYFAMEFISGEAITEYVATRAVSIEERLKLFVRVCDAVQYAHDQGVIHRDLKPDNILIDQDGRPHVLDFGVARLADPETPSSVRTLTGQVLGTLSYMSPEQISGDSKLIDSRTDVYALGVILYELLTDELPYDFTGKTIAQAAVIVRDEQPSPLSSIRRLYRGDLETIARKALEKDPVQRYGSPRELAADIRRHLNDEPIVARPPSAIYQLRKFVRRNRGLCIAGGLVSSLIVMASIVSMALAINATLHRRRAETSAERARSVSQFLLDTILIGNHSEDGLLIKWYDAHRLVNSRAIDDPEVEASLRLLLGRRYRAAGSHDLAREHFLRALELRRQEHGEQSEEYLEAMIDLGDLALFEGRLEPARELALDAIELHEAMYGADHWSERHADRLEELYLATIVDPVEHQRERRRLRALQEEAFFNRAKFDVPEPLPARQTTWSADFDDAQLDEDWVVNMERCSDWTHELHDSKLHIGGIEVTGTDPYHPASLRLTKWLPDPFGDFHAELHLEWDSHDRVEVIQTLYLMLLNSGSEFIAYGGFTDAWILLEGGIGGEIRGAGASVQSGGGTMEAAGEAVISIDRVGDHVRLSWNGRPYAAGTCADPLEAVQILVKHHEHSMPGRVSAFGELAVEKILIEGTALRD